MLYVNVIIDDFLIKFLFLINNSMFKDWQKSDKNINSCIATLIRFYANEMSFFTKHLLAIQVA